MKSSIPLLKESRRDALSGREVGVHGVLAGGWGSPDMYDAFIFGGGLDTPARGRGGGKEDLGHKRAPARDDSAKGHAFTGGGDGGTDEYLSLSFNRDACDAPHGGSGGGFDALEEDLREGNGGLDGRLGAAALFFVVHTPLSSQIRIQPGSQSMT